jgi:glycosyltransferase involved in cell wall biosynthesis
MNKVGHLSSAHNRFDTRIFFKQCQSLANNNRKVSLVIADGLGNEVRDDISIFDVGKQKNRFRRIFKTTNDVYKKALELNCDIYHLHDPELIRIGLKLKRDGKKVIFDIHENIAFQILSKEYIPKFLRKIISKIYRLYEIKKLKKFDALIIAEHSYKKYYSSLNKNLVTVLNMPKIDHLKKFYSDNRTNNEIFYIGGISNNRGFDVLIQALKILRLKIPNIFAHFIGPFSKKLIDNEQLKDIKDNFKLYGSLPLTKGLKYSQNSKIGLSVLKPITNYTQSYSTKIFEYMAIGLPVITSNFKLYKDIIDENNCGICVDPENPNEIAKAIELILTNPEKAKEMGQNGSRLVKEKYNWNNEEFKLINIYKKLGC